MASLRRSKNMATDGATPKFLYTILKQLDLKSIDWNHVASNLDITNGHAARMRFSRFKQQMEGIPPAPRKPRSTVPRQKKPKREKPKSKKEEALQEETFKEDELKEEANIFVKPEPRDDMQPVFEEPILHPAALIKEELVDESYGDDGAGMEWLPLEPHEHPQQDFFEPYQHAETRYPSHEFMQVKEEPRVKMEPVWTS